MLQIKEFTKNVYRVYGEVVLPKTTYREVVVDGLTYKNETTEYFVYTITDADYSDAYLKLDFTKNYDEVKDNLHFDFRYFDQFNIFGIESLCVQAPDVKGYNGHKIVDYAFNENSNYDHSQNEYIFILKYFIEEKRPSLWVDFLEKYYDTYYDIKRSYKSYDYQRNNYNLGIVEFVLQSWGFNNKLTMIMQLQDILKFDLKKLINREHESYLKKYFPSFSVSMSEQQKLDLLINIALNK